MSKIGEPIDVVTAILGGFAAGNRQDVLLLTLGSWTPCGDLHEMPTVRATLVTVGTMCATRMAPIVWLMQIIFS
eukprot:4259843-Pyramimonas_sp.AAC.1